MLGWIKKVFGGDDAAPPARQQVESEAYEEDEYEEDEYEEDEYEEDEYEEDEYEEDEYEEDEYEEDEYEEDEYEEDEYEEDEYEEDEYEEVPQVSYQEPEPTLPMAAQAPEPAANPGSSFKASDMQARLQSFDFASESGEALAEDDYEIEDDDGEVYIDPGELADYDLSLEYEEPTEEELSKLDEITELVFNHFRANRGDLPAFPSLAGKVFEIIDKPEADVGELVNVIRQDPAISAQVIKVANSAYYSRGVDVVSIRMAVVRLGLNEVAKVAAAASTRALFDLEVRAAHEVFSQKWHDLWLHSMTTAFGCGWLSLERNMGDPDQVFLGGMLHDIGKTVCLRSLSALMFSGDIPYQISDAMCDHILEEMHVDLGGEMAFYGTCQYLI